MGMMEKIAYTNRKPLRIGDIRYLSGKATKVEIVGNENGMYPEVKVLEKSKLSKFQVGQIIRIYRRILYPYNAN